jgi:hypothetical protein
MADSPYEAVATAIKAVIDAEFAAESITAIQDNIHEALGRTGVAVGIAPIEDLVQSSNNVVQETWAEVRFFDLWDAKIDPEQAVNPFKITAYADRFRQAIRRASVTTPGTGQVWYFDLQRVQYPNDPTGNKTRFVATIRAYGNNSGLVETSG